MKAIRFSVLLSLFASLGCDNGGLPGIAGGINQRPDMGVSDMAASTTAVDSSTTSADPFERGKLVYAAYCGFCHGDDGEGYSADNANALSNQYFLASADDAFLTAAIVHGRPGTPMSAWGREESGPLGAADVQEVVRLIRSWQTKANVSLGARHTGNAADAEQNYATFCASCHGASGDGVTALSLNNPWFLNTASDGLIRYAIEEGRPGTSMGPYKNSFSAQETEDLVALIRSWQEPVPMTGESIYVPDLTDLVINPNGQEPEFTLREDKFVPVDDVHAAIEAGQSVILLDARAHGDYLYGHISGAVSLPFYALPDYIEELPRDTWIITYCGCPHAISGRAWQALRDEGFEKTAVLDEGYYVWRDRGYPISGVDMPMPEPATP
tara:strand:+ start:63 stop:1211 length:1149 start_codon:yes stop_codon:yes gene_type:complete